MTEEKDDSSIEDIGCLEAIEMLYAYLDGELSNTQLEKFEHHMGHCRSCYSRSEFEMALNKRIKDSAKDEAPETLQKRLREIMDKF